MKIGVRVRIDVKKIFKQWLFSGQKGTYLNATTFIDIDNQDQYNNNGMITQDPPKDVQEKGPILGNVQVFWKEEGQQQTPQQQAPAQPQQQFNSGMPAHDEGWDDDIPFALRIAKNKRYMFCV